MFRSDDGRVERERFVVNSINRMDGSKEINDNKQGNFSLQKAEYLAVLVIVGHG